MTFRRIWPAVIAGFLALVWVLAGPAHPATAVPRYCTAIYNYAIASKALDAASLQGIATSAAQYQRINQGIKREWSQSVFYAIGNDSDADARRLAQAWAVNSGLKRASAADQATARKTYFSIVSKKCGSEPLNIGFGNAYPW